MLTVIIIFYKYFVLLWTPIAVYTYMIELQKVVLLQSL